MKYYIVFLFISILVKSGTSMKVLVLDTRMPGKEDELLVYNIDEGIIINETRKKYQISKHQSLPNYTAETSNVLKELETVKYSRYGWMIDDNPIPIAWEAWEDFIYIDKSKSIKESDKLLGKLMIFSMDDRKPMVYSDYTTDGPFFAYPFITVNLRKEDVDTIPSAATYKISGWISGFSENGILYWKRINGTSGRKDGSIIFRYDGKDEVEPIEISVNTKENKNNDLARKCKGDYKNYDIGEIEYKDEDYGEYLKKEEDDE